MPHFFISGQEWVTGGYICNGAYLIAFLIVLITYILSHGEEPEYSYLIIMQVDHTELSPLSFEFTAFLSDGVWIGLQ
jgi:hypothetical protein